MASTPFDTVPLPLEHNAFYELLNKEAAALSMSQSLDAMTYATIMQHPRPSSWSFSSYKLHMQCPSKYRFKYIDKLPEERAGAASRGIDIHSDIEAFITGTADAIDSIHPVWLGVLHKLRGAGADVQAELKLAFSSSWQPVEWSSTEAWGRAVLDAAMVTDPPNTPAASLDIYEWKTGKRYEEHGEQALFYGALSHIYREFQEVRVHVCYVDSQKITMETQVVDAKLAAHVRRSYDERLKLFFTDTIYPARPSFRCQWCSFRRSNNGPCAHG